MSFVDSFRKRYGRDPTKEDVERILAEEFDIRPDANGVYHRKQFESLWRFYGIAEPPRPN